MYVRVSAAGSLQKSGVVVDVKKESGILRVDHGVTINLMQHEVRVRIYNICLLYTSPSPRDGLLSRMPSSA